MKRLSALLALILLINLAGCCYAPGTEGMYGMDSWYMNVPTFPVNQDVAQSDQPTEGPGETPIENASIAIPDPEVNLDILPPRVDTDFVKVKDYIPDLVVDLKYSTVDNFTGERVYEFNDLYLRYGTVLKLMEVQKELRQHGLLMKVWDGFRPTGAQKILWNAKPDPAYVSNPATGYSNHSRGNTVDVTLVDASGEEVEMPSGYDAFSALGDRDYSDCSQKAAENAQLLEDVMTKYGFVGYEGEWWHYADQTEYDVEKVFDPSVVALWKAECNQYINLRVAADYTSEAIAQIPKNYTFTLLGYVNGFAYVEYKGQRGYVNADYISPF